MIDATDHSPYSARLLFKRSGLIAVLVLLAGWLAGGPVQAGQDAGDPDRTYQVYVGAESEDLMHRVRFHPGHGAEVVQTTAVGELYNKTEGPHGVAVGPQGEYLYMTTGHGNPDGKLWKYELGSMEQVAEPIALGRFPATLDVTPDGDYAFVVNFNLHGEMVPSSVSVVYLPEFVEVARPEVGVMPHGSRITPDGRHQYSGIMMDDHLVEIDTRSFRVSRRFNVAAGQEVPLPADDGEADSGEPHGGNHRSLPAEHESTCSPTWAQPSASGRHIYVACNDNDQVLEIAREEWELTRRFDTGEGPYNIDVSSDGRIMAVTLKQGDGMEFIDLYSGEMLARHASSTTVTHGVVISPDSRYAFVSVEGVGAEPGKVDIYDLQELERVDSVEVGKQASGIDFWKMKDED